MALLIFCALLVVSSVALRLYLVYPIDEAAVQAVLNGVKDQFSTLPPPAENRLVGVYEAQEEFEGPADLPEFEAPWLEWGDFLLGNVDVPDPDYAARFPALMAATKGLFEAAEKALRRPQSAVPLDFTAGEFLDDDKFDVYLLNDVHQLLLLACYLEVQVGRLPRALEILEADLILIEDLLRPKGWTGRIWAEGMIHDVVRFLPRFYTLATAHGDDPSLAADLDAAINRIRGSRGTIRDVMRFEMFSFEVIAWRLKAKISYSRQKKKVPLWQKIFWLDIMGPSILNGFFERERNIRQKYYLDVLEVLKGDEPAVTFDQVEKLIIAAKARLWFGSIFNRLFTSFHSTYRKHLETTAFFNAAPALVALERYRLAKGSYPATLADLVTAGLLKAVPREPFSPAQELKYLLQEEGGYYDLRSVGKNLKATYDDHSTYDDILLNVLVGEE